MRTLKLNSITGLASRISLALYYFLVSRWIVSALGEERFGIYSYVATLGQITPFLDLGIGNGALNRLTEAHARGERSEVSSLVSTAWWLLVTVAITAFLLVTVLDRGFGLDKLLSMSGPNSGGETGGALRAYLIVTVLGIPFSVVQRLQLATQQSFLNDCFQIGGLIATAITIYLVLPTQHSIVPVILLMTLGPLTFWFLDGTLQCFVLKPWISLSPSLVSRAKAEAMLKSGWWFLLLNANGFIFLGMDQYFAGKHLGPIGTARYGAAARPFGLVLFAIQSIIFPLWPAYRAALAKGNLDWIRQTLRRSVGLVALAALLGSSMMMLVEPRLIAIWLGKPTLVPDFDLTMAFAAWTFVQCVGAPIATYFNAFGLLRFQLVLGVASSLLCVILKDFACEHFGLTGMVWAGAICYGSANLFPTWLARAYILRQPAASLEPSAAAVDRLGLA